MNIPLSLLTICHMKALKNCIEIPQISSLDWQLSIKKASLCILGRIGSPHHILETAVQRGYLDVAYYIMSKDNVDYDYEKLFIISSKMKYYEFIRYLLYKDTKNEMKMTIKYREAIIKALDNKDERYIAHVAKRLIRFL